MKKPILLIANRGEIAIRVARTARRLGFQTVGVYSTIDASSDHLKVMDRAYCVGNAAPRESYLNIEVILDVAKKSGATFVHPGYGFLSERPQFVEACIAAGLTFVGPSAESMRVMGDKIAARTTVHGLGVSGVPGSPGAVREIAEIEAIATKIGFPVLLKAAAGGGGKGMRRVDRIEDLASNLESAQREALSAFGDDAIYIEKYILGPHHVEIQVFGDGKGRAVHLGERECSIQRRHQKVWEETPSPLLDRFPQTREKMFEAAVRIAEGIRYAGAGTFEFIADEAGNFYFLEMNTRLQVEHPVTEWVTGVDLVEWQLLLARAQAGQLAWELPSTPERRGSSIEVRLYAEDPMSFLPSPGPLGSVRAPGGPFVRWDSGVSSGGEVSMHYDPMIAKLSVWGAERSVALGRMRVALEETLISRPKNQNPATAFDPVGSLTTNQQLLERLTRHPRVIAGDTTTDLIASDPSLTAEQDLDSVKETEWAAVAVAIAESVRNAGSAR